MRALLFGLVAAFLVLLGPPAAAQDDGEMLRGVLRDAEGEPVSGVEIIITQDGAEVGRAESGEDGVWEVPLPGPGDYTATLNEETLPEGISLRDPERNPLEGVTVRPNQRRTLIFALGEGGVVAPRVLRAFLQRAVEGIKFGTIIAMTAVGLSLIFGATRLINFAHGELVTIGAALAFLLNASIAGPRLHLIPAAVLAVVGGGVAGAAVDRGLWKPLRQRNTGLIQMFIISIGLSLFLRHVILILLGGRPRPYAQYALQRAVQVGPIVITPRDMVVLVLSFAVLIGVGLVLSRTRIGKATRAVADNRDLAESSGINVERVILFVWVFGGSLAALGGVLFGLTEVVAWDMGFNLLLLMFAGVILGGLGTAYGAMVGSLLVGLVAQLSTLWFPIELQNAWALAVLILILLVRPQGILGRPERIG